MIIIPLENLDDQVNYINGQSKFSFQGKIFARGASFPKKYQQKIEEVCEKYTRSGLSSLVVESPLGFTIWVEDPNPINKASETNSLPNPWKTLPQNPPLNAKPNRANMAATKDEESPEMTKVLPSPLRPYPPKTLPQTSPSNTNPAIARLGNSQVEKQSRETQVYQPEDSQTFSHNSPVNSGTNRNINVSSPKSHQNFPSNSSANSRPIIACIDDSKTVHTQVKMALDYAGYDLLSITEPAASLTQLIRVKPALILLDINMPDIDGYELCRMLQRSRKLRDIPIVMLTGREGMIDRIKAKLVGANHYLTKPFEPEELIEVVQHLAVVSPDN